MRFPTPTAALAALALILTGCAADGSSDEATEVPAESATPLDEATDLADEPADTPTSEPTSEPTTEDPLPEDTVDVDAGLGTDGTYKLGETAEYNDLLLTIGEPEPFEPSPNSSAAEAAGAPVQMLITIENVGGEPYDSAEFRMDAQSGTSVAEQLYDTAQGFDGSPSVTLLPGRSIKFPLAFAVEDPSDVVVEATVDMFSTESVGIIFTSS